MKQELGKWKKQNTKDRKHCTRKHVNLKVNLQTKSWDETYISLKIGLEIFKTVKKIEFIGHILLATREQNNPKRSPNWNEHSNNNISLYHKETEIRHISFETYK